MSILIDDLLKKENTQTTTLSKKDSKWYIAKPIPFYSFKRKIQLIKDGLRVMSGRSFAVHYKEDE